MAHDERRILIGSLGGQNFAIQTTTHKLALPIIAFGIAIGIQSLFDFLKYLLFDSGDHENGTFLISQNY